MRAVPLAAALLSTAVLAPTGVHAQLSRLKIDTVGSHVVRVMNPGPTAWADTNGWKLVLERTIQPKGGEPGELQNPSTVLRSSTGQFVIGDYNAPDVALFDATGHFAKRLGRSGEGPSEYQSPFIALYRDTVVIQDPGLSRVTFMTLDGKVVRSFPAMSNSIGFALEIDGTGRVRVPVFNGKGQQWNFYSLSGRALDSLPLPLAAPPQQWSYSSGGGHGTSSIPFAASTSHRLLRDGSMLYGSTETYQLLLSRTGRDTVRIFGRTGVSGARIPESLRDSMFRLVTKNPGIRSVAKESDIPRNYPVWFSLHEDGTGNFWVLTGGPRGVHEFDVFARDGRFLGTVPLPFKANNVSLLGDRIGVIGTDANDLPIIRIYRIDRRGK